MITRQGAFQKLSLFFLSLGGLAQNAHARLYNYEDLPVGERSAGMGNVGVALTNDVGVSYYNPAAVAWSEGDQVASALAAYTRIDTRTGDYVSLFQSARDNLNRGGFLSIPSMTGGFLKKGDWMWGGTILVPAGFENSGSIMYNTTDRANFKSRFEDIWVSFFVNKKMNPQTSVGAGLFYVSRSSTEEFSFLTNPSSSVDIRFVETTWEANGMLMVAGATTWYTPKTLLGISLRTPAWKWGGRGRYSEVKNGDTVIEAQDFATRAFPLPFRVSIGFSHEFDHEWTLTSDLHVYSPLNQDLSPLGQAAFQFRLHTLVNGHIGVERFLSPTLGFRLGFFTNISAADAVPLSLSAIHDRVQMFGGTWAMVLRKQSGTISLGAWAQGGQGRSVSIDPTTTGHVPRSNYIYGVSVGSTYKF